MIRLTAAHLLWIALMTTSPATPLTAPASAVLVAAPVAAAPPNADRWDKRKVEAFATKLWKARPQTKFERWDPEVREQLFTEAGQLGELPPGQLRELVELLWKPLRKYGPRAKGEILQTPYGEARWIQKGKGRGDGLVLGLHGGGEGAGDAASATGWSAKDCMGMYPQGIRLVHDTWNTVHGERFLLTLIEIAKATHEIDPDRVYTMGFSMGGTGSWFMAGRHPDLLAGSSPCAGVLMANPKAQLPTKEEVIELQHGFVPNVRNLAMYYYIGLADKNCMPGTYLYVWDRILALRAADQGGYQNIQFRTYPGLAHAFPPGEPAKGMEWLGKQVRDPLPQKIVWEYASDPFPQAPEGDPLGRLPKNWYYWLHCANPQDNMSVVATRAGNDFSLTIERADKRDFSVLLNPDMIDVDEDVVIRVDDRVVFRGRPEPSIREVVMSLEARLDRRLVFDRRVTIE